MLTFWRASDMPKKGRRLHENGGKIGKFSVFLSVNSRFIFHLAKKLLPERNWIGILNFFPKKIPKFHSKKKYFLSEYDDKHKPTNCHVTKLNEMGFLYCLVVGHCHLGQCVVTTVNVNFTRLYGVCDMLLRTSSGKLCSYVYW